MGSPHSVVRAETAASANARRGLADYFRNLLQLRLGKPNFANRLDRATLRVKECFCFPSELSMLPILAFY